MPKSDITFFLSSIMRIKQVFESIMQQSEALSIDRSDSNSDEQLRTGGQYKRKMRWVNKIYKIVKAYALDFVALGMCLFLGYIIALTLFRSDQKQVSNGILASSGILLNKGLRGIFPPLDGEVSDLVGTWNVKVVNSQESSRWEEFNSYSLNLKASGDMQLLSANCSSSIRMQWRTFYYNFYVRETPQKDDEMKIPNDPQDVDCIMGKGELYQILLHASIWTVDTSYLYLVSEIQSLHQIKNHLLILSRAN